MVSLKKYVLFVILLITLFLASCDFNKKVLSTAVSQINSKTDVHKSQLHEYDSPYTICYENRDETYTLYIYTSPIQYKTEEGYEIIDNTIVKSTIERYEFENKANEIKTYFPKKLSEDFLIVREYEYIKFIPGFDASGFSEAKETSFCNMYGDYVSAVVYESKDADMYFYPTKAGIKSELLLKKKPANDFFCFNVKTGGSLYENKQNGYILFKNGDKNYGIIYAPLIKASDKFFSIKSSMDISEQSDRYMVRILPDSDVLNNDTVYPVRLDMSFELYQSKMPDTAVYSDFANNSYLSNYAVIGNSSLLGEGWNYLRLRLNYVVGLQQSKINSVSYNINYLNSVDYGVLNLFLLSEQWSSSNMTWTDKPVPTENIAGESMYSSKHTITFDITAYAKECFSDSQWQMESNGLVIKLEGGNSNVVLATSDNSLYPPYIKIVLNKLPAYFEPKENINP